jgi:hypothetical protein
MGLISRIVTAVQLDCQDAEAVKQNVIFRPRQALRIRACWMR